MVVAFGLSEIELPGEGCDLGIRRVGPRGEEGRFDGNFLCVVDDEPCSKVVEHGFDGGIAISDVLLAEFVKVSGVRVDGNSHPNTRHHESLITNH